MTESLGCLSIEDMTKINVYVQEDNPGALTLTETITPQFIPRSKYYCARTVWFREEIMKSRVGYHSTRLTPRISWVIFLQRGCLGLNLRMYLLKQLMG